MVSYLDCSKYISIVFSIPTIHQAMKNLLLLLFLLTAGVLPLFAQESSEEDSYSDYSYLWEDSKKNKKKKKKNKKNTSSNEETKTVETLVSSDTLDIVTDTAPEIDSVSLEEDIAIEATSPPDTVTEKSNDLETVETVVEIATINTDSINRVQNLQDSVKKAEKLQKRTARNEKNKDKEPKEDFRAGLPSSQSGSKMV